MDPDLDYLYPYVIEAQDLTYHPQTHSDTVRDVHTHTQRSESLLYYSLAIIPEVHSDFFSQFFHFQAIR